MPRKAHLLRTARIWATWGDAANYRTEPAPERPGTVAVRFQSPEQPSPEFQRQQEETFRSIGDFNIQWWADRSFRSGGPDTTFELMSVITFARSRDSADLLKVLADAGEGATQTCVAAAASVAAAFATDPEDQAWGWAVLARIDGLQDQANRLYYSRNPYDPRQYLIAALLRDLRKNDPRPDSAERLLMLATQPNPEIAQTALAALLSLDNNPRLAWIAATVATQLFSSHFPDMEDDGSRDRSRQESYRLEVRQRALSALKDETLPSLSSPPEPWVQGPRQSVRRRALEGELEWQHPAFDFHPSFAKEIVGRFPVEGWMSDMDRREPFLTYLDQLVAWTKGRLFPSWADDDEHRRRSTDLFEWLDALSHLVARASAFWPAGDTISRFVRPIGDHEHEDALKFVADFTQNLVCRHVYDARAITDDTISLLRHHAQGWVDAMIPARIAGVVQQLAEANHPLNKQSARELLTILDRLVDMGDRRAAALQQSEHFRGVQLAEGTLV